MILYPLVAFVRFFLPFARLVGFDGIKIRDDILARLFIEIGSAFKSLDSFAFDFDQECIASPDHVFHDAPGSNRLGWIVLIEREFHIASSDVENAYFPSGHIFGNYIHEYSASRM